MHRLTTKLLDTFPFTYYADARSIQRGRTYYRDGRVQEIIFSEDMREATCQVDGELGEYTVELEVDQTSGELFFDCDCPYAEQHFCKHMIAAALAVRDYLQNNAAENAGRSPASAAPNRPQRNAYWQSQLEQVLSQAPRPSTRTGASIQRYAAVLLLAKDEYYSYGSYSFRAYLIKASDWYPLDRLAPGDAQTINELLDKDPSWISHAQAFPDQANPAGCLNLGPEAIGFLSFLQQYGRFFGGSSVLAGFFPLIAQLKIPVFIAGKFGRTVGGRCRILSEPVGVEVWFTHEKGNLLLQAGLTSETFTPTEGKIETITYNPPWLLSGNTIFPLRNPGNLSLIASFPISIPEEHSDLFREKYLRRVAEALPIKSDLIQWHEIDVDPVPRLYLHDDQDNVLRADLCFAYGEYELPAVKSEQPLAVETVPDSWELLRIHRRQTREQHFYQLLTDPIYRLKRTDRSQPFGTFQLRAHSHPFDFLMYSIPQLTQAGFEIYGEEKLKLGRINRAAPTLRVHISSGIDWFDLNTVVEFGDQQISFQKVGKALKRGENYVKLADGSVGQIPKEWLEKYKHLWNLAKETEDGFRVSNFHLPLIDSLLEEDATLQAPADLSQRRETLRSFERIAPQPLPKGFTGQLRPYQKHGLDWLHFLREYNFGGILADDMGLGKTVQVLAYLQSLRERVTGGPATLLVVPKSLITNWQRESERFTPALRFLEYVGNSRNKDTSAFNEYDIVLTTYGTLLRDIEVLRAYKFSHAILDESQAIKNPLAKTAKASRLVCAEHRLVMTGTPVENNTFELWSQFAFLNPGLLGNMEYFKHEFANPIETAGDEKSAALLRKLIYPFILRRTKEQVAPELPPRTERIIYADMGPAQKKLYTQTRERYRAELMGLIESTGMNDARFKILEGLLRLRQIAIHPALTDKKYRGEAPKFEILLEILETLRAENHKALIFSQFVETLKLLRRELDERQIKYVYLDGQTANRQSRVDLFQNDPSTTFFLISLKAGGVGLNLTSADYVLHLDPWWNPAVEMQASDRAHRIGQAKPVFIYKIITRETVEERILQLQEKKRALVKSLIATETGFFKALTKDDVDILFA